MDGLALKLESLAEKLIEDIKTSPVKTLLWSLLVVYLIMKVIKLARR